MSADNWTTCPRCERRHQDKARQMRAAADEAYGSVSVAEWKQMDADALAAGKPLEGRTFREDYEIDGADDGNVVVKYSGGCGVCCLSCDFRHEHLIDGIDA